MNFVELCLSTFKVGDILHKQDIADIPFVVVKHDTPGHILVSFACKEFSDLLDQPGNFGFVHRLPFRQLGLYLSHL